MRRIWIVFQVVIFLSCGQDTIQRAKPYYQICFISSQVLKCLMTDGSILDVADDVSFASLNESGTSVCFVRGKEVLCVGVGSEDTKGLGFYTISDRPVRVAQNLKQFYFGRRFGCALRSDGKVMCFGKNSFGQIPGCTDFCEIDEVSPVPITEEIVKVDVGKWHVCALSVEGNLYCWGRNWDGQVGTGRRAGKVSQPSYVLGNVSDFCTGGWHTCAVSGNNIFCWGEATYGQYDGRGGSGADILEPITSPVFTGEVKKIDCGQAHTCILSSAGDVICWGWAEKGQLGETREKTAKVKLWSEAKDLWVEGDTTCVLDEKLLCWGDGEKRKMVFERAEMTSPRRFFYLWDAF